LRIVVILEEKQALLHLLLKVLRFIHLGKAGHWMPSSVRAFLVSLALTNT
jgi:hypothetical protein